MRLKNNNQDLHAKRRDIKLQKKLKPKDNRKSIRLIARLSSKLRQR